MKENKNEISKIEILDKELKELKSRLLTVADMFEIGNWSKEDVIDELHLLGSRDGAK